MKQKFYVAKQTYNLEKETIHKPNKSRSTERNKQTTHYQRSELFTTNLFSHPDCLSCGENINHPLCPNCIAKAFSQWSKKYSEYHGLKGKLNIFMKHHNHINGNSKSCVHCGKNVHVCPYCFTEYLYKLVKEAGLGVRAMTEFLFIFNFDFKHNGYSQELEAFGGY